MRSDQIGQAYIKDAKIIMEEARESLEKGHHHRTIRKCQESVELALKGLLRLIGIEYPKSHRVGDILLESSLRDEVSEELFTKEDAHEALSMAEYTMDFIDNLLRRHDILRQGDFR